MNLMESRGSRDRAADSQQHEVSGVDRNRDIIVLIMRFLYDYGLMTSYQSLCSEVGFSLNQIDTIDTVDLWSIVKDYVEFFHIRYARYPKLVQQVQIAAPPPTDYRVGLSGSYRSGSPPKTDLLQHHQLQHQQQQQQQQQHSQQQQQQQHKLQLADFSPSLLAAIQNHQRYSAGGSGTPDVALLGLGPQRSSSLLLPTPNGVKLEVGPSKSNYDAGLASRSDLAISSALQLAGRNDSLQSLAARNDSLQLLTGRGEGLQSLAGGGRGDGLAGGRGEGGSHQTLVLDKGGASLMSKLGVRDAVLSNMEKSSSLLNFGGGGGLLAGGGGGSGNGGVGGKHQLGGLGVSLQQPLQLQGQSMPSPSGLGLGSGAALLMQQQQQQQLDREESDSGSNMFVALTTRLGCSERISQEDFCDILSQHPLSKPSHVLGFTQPRRTYSNRRSSNLTLNDTQEEALYALVGCTGVGWLIKNLNTATKDFLRQRFDIDKELLQLFFKNRAQKVKMRRATGQSTLPSSQPSPRGGDGAPRSLSDSGDMDDAEDMGVQVTKRGRTGDR